MAKQPKGLCRYFEASKVVHGGEMPVQKTSVLSISLCLLFFVLSACCAPIKSKQEVDVMPLHLEQVRQDANQVDDLIDLGIFDTYDSAGFGNWTSQGDNPDLVGVEVYFWLSADAKSGRENFLWECQRWWKTTDDFVFGGSEDNQYCISYVSAERHSPDGLCLTTGRYLSSVVFQKGRLLTTIHEYAPDKNSHA